MEKIEKEGAAMDELEGNSSSSSVLKLSIVNKFMTELENSEMHKLTPKLVEILTKCMDESLKEIQFSNPLSQLTDDVGVGTARPIPVLEQSAQSNLPPLVFQFLKPGNEWVMGMMINGKPEVVKNEKGSESTSPYAGFTDDSTLVYGTDAEIYCESRDCYEFWCSYEPGRPNRTVHLKGFGMFDLPALFFHALLIRKLKITAEGSQCNGELGQCQAAILAVPMETTYANRLHLKEAALFAGFQDAFVISAEGLAAYYWFHKNKTEMEGKNYSKDFVIVKLSWTAVVYKRSFDAGTDGKRNLVVTPIVSLSRFTFGGPCKTIEEEEFVEVIRTLFKLDENAVIPVVGNFDRLLWFSNGLRTLDQNKIKSVDEDESDLLKYFAAKGAALLSQNPESIGRQVRNMMETVRIEPFNELPVLITRRDQILPETSAQRTFNIEHTRTKYRISQDYETVGYLVIHEVEFGLDLQVSYELSWEGIWKVVGVSSKHPSDEGYKAVSWKWLIGDEVDEQQFGSSLYEEYRSLLLKILPSPSEAKVAFTEDDISGSFPPNTSDGAEEESASVCSNVDGNEKRKMLATKSGVIKPNDVNGSKDELLKKVLPSSSQVKMRTARLAKVGATTAGLENSQGQSVGLGSSSIDSGYGNGMQEKKRCRKGRVLCTNDIIVNPHLKKIKLESDWVEPVAKIEQDSVNDFGEDGKGHQVNFMEHEIDNDEDVVKIEVEEEDNATD